MASATAGAGAGAGAGVALDFDAIIAVDFGTHGTAYSVCFQPDDSVVGDLHKMIGEVIPFKPGEGMGSADKQLSALLVDSTAAHALVQFGSRAREQFAEMCDDAKSSSCVTEAHEAQRTAVHPRRNLVHSTPLSPEINPCSALYFHTFKMRLARSDDRPRDLTQIQVPAVGKVNAGGHAGTTGGYHPEVPLLTLVQRVLEYVKKDAAAYVCTRIRTDFAKVSVPRS